VAEAGLAVPAPRHQPARDRDALPGVSVTASPRASRPAASCVASKRYAYGSQPIARHSSILARRWAISCRRDKGPSRACRARPSRTERRL
jgi:hypothetical protein